MSEAPRPQRFAVIDIGSNATRLHIATYQPTQPQKRGWVTETFVRIPLALGQEVFSSPKQQIGIKNRRRLQKTLAGMNLIIETFAPIRTRTVATAAIRAARNSEKIVQETQQNIQMKINILTGAEEAQVIGTLAATQFIDSNVINLDVGGGSTDCAAFVAGNMVAHDTFLVGTAQQDDSEEKKRLQTWLRHTTKTHAIEKLTATGGSIANLKSVCPVIDRECLQKIVHLFKKLSVEEISNNYNIPPDSVRYTLPAIEIYRLALKSSGISNVEVVQGGLSDAIMRQLLRR